MSFRKVFHDPEYKCIFPSVSWIKRPSNSKSPFKLLETSIPIFSTSLFITPRQCQRSEPSQPLCSSAILFIKNCFKDWFQHWFKFSSSGYHYRDNFTQGRLSFQKRMNFWKISERGVGHIRSKKNGCNLFLIINGGSYQTWPILFFYI